MRIRTLLADRHLEHARSQAPAWERTVLEAPPPEAFEPMTFPQAEPAIHWVPRQSLGTRFKSLGTKWWRLLLRPRPCATMMILYALLANGLRADEPAEYIGRAGCASATCHGGIQGQGPAWNSSLRSWEANDDHHANAGLVLMNKQSAQIVRVLTGGSAFDDKSIDEEVRDVVLRERCVSCHAPSLASKLQVDDRDHWRIGIREGVSCEACHGPASNWLAMHTLIEPDDTKLAASGKLATKPWLDRTDNCVRCHVGSRTQTGIVRDVNHDLIAAGHPALQFDMSQMQFKLPAHWNVAELKRFRMDSPVLAGSSTNLPSNKLAPDLELATPNEHYQARARVLAAVTRLSIERHAASSAGHAPWPELAEYNCSACHQSIHYQSPSIVSKSHRLTWNTFYTQQAAFNSNLFPNGNGRKPMGGEEMLAKLSVLLKASEAHPFKPIDITDAMSLAAEQPILQQSSPNWQLAASWLWSNRLMVLNAFSKHETGVTSQAYLSPDVALELTGLLNEFDRNLDVDSQSSASSIDLIPVSAIGPEHINFERLVSIREQYRSKLASIINKLHNSPEAGANP